MKNQLIAMTIATSLVLIAPSALASDKWKKESKDAWIDGKAEATLLFNGNLNSFKINTDVNDGVVILTGKVDSSVDKDLAEELIIGIKGVTKVDNRLSVVEKPEKKSAIKTSFVDKKIATVVTSRYLFDSDLSAVDIDVDVDEGHVVLSGEVDSDAAKDLAEQIAKNASGVKSVINRLEVADAE